MVSILLTSRLPIRVACGNDKLQRLLCVLVVGAVTSSRAVNAEHVGIVFADFADQTQNTFGRHDVVLAARRCGQRHREPLWKKLGTAVVIFFGNLLF